MKTATGITGYFSLGLIIAGSLFKIQHWPGAGPMLVVGVILFAFGFLTLYLIDQVINRKSKIDIFLAISTVVTLWFLSLGLLFKVQHWPGAGPLIVFGLTLFAFFFLPVFVYGFIKLKEFSGFNVLGLLLGIAGLMMVLSVNVSKDVLLSYVGNNRMIEENVFLFEKANEQLLNGDSTSTKIHERTKRMLKLIQDYKIELISQTEKLPEDVTATDLHEINLKDNYDVPTYILIGNDPTNPKEDEWSATRLKKELQSYAEEMSTYASDEESKRLIKESFSLNSITEIDRQFSWEVGTFYHSPLASVITSLSVLQASVLSIETTVLAERNKKP